jgi:hypothetical protein
MRPQIVKNIKILALTALCFLISAVMLGQADAARTGPPSPTFNRAGPCGGGPIPNELCMPIDSGLLFLLIAGLGYGLYITTKRMKAKNISR